MNASNGAQGREAIASRSTAARPARIANTRSWTARLRRHTPAVAYAQAPRVRGAGGYAVTLGASARRAGTQVEVNVTGPSVRRRRHDAAVECCAACPPSCGGARHGGVTDLRDGLAKLDRATDRILGALGSVGARTNRIEAMKAKAEQQRVTVTNSLAEVESIDLPKTIMELQMQEVAYKSALGATARVVQPSLLDFLR
jgi:flagellar hook-associated protein 3 FlgL